MWLNFIVCGDPAEPTPARDSHSAIQAHFARNVLATASSAGVGRDASDVWGSRVNDRRFNAGVGARVVGETALLRLCSIDTKPRLRGLPRPKALTPRVIANLVP